MTDEFIAIVVICKWVVALSAAVIAAILTFAFLAGPVGHDPVVASFVAGVVSLACSQFVHRKLFQ